MNYCASIYRTKRRKTREVMVGNVGVGGDNPVRIQSMTNSSTRDVAATIDQILRLYDAGCEIARVTVQGMKEAEACEEIREGLAKRNCPIPLVADIHFFPPAAMRAADFVDKVRINPGNYVDKRATFKQIEYDEASYAEELLKIEEKFTPLVEKCRKLKRSLRIGTNHGSLSDRIMNRYGDTPAGMVESALEFARICRKNAFHDIIFSMKSSNPLVMVQAYRLLVREMNALDWDYPLHLGVTEAGEGEDGRIKSAMGMGSLLLDGLGDTIRVSLTEDPWEEIDPCRRLRDFATEYEGRGVAPFTETHRPIDRIERREVNLPKNLSFHRDGTVVLSVSHHLNSVGELAEAGGLSLQSGMLKIEKDSADQLLVKGAPVNPEIYQTIADCGVSVVLPTPLDTLSSVAHKFSHPFRSGEETLLIQDMSNWEMIPKIRPSAIYLSPKEDRLHFCRRFFEWLQEKKIKTPVILNFSYSCSKEDLIIRASAEMGALLCDGLGEGVCIEGEYPAPFLRNLEFGILQAARMRTIKTEFISCPSCGRTLFDLQDVTRRIRSRTSHLAGVKIAIMGCIVNGPGEMADAHFGYVGSKPGKIDLYVGREKVKAGIDFADADEKLVELIKSHDMWEEP